MVNKSEQSRLRNFVQLPSVGAVLYQGLALSTELKALSVKEYSKQALQIRDVFLSIVDYLHKELLQSLGDQKDCDNFKREDMARFLACAEALRCIYRNLRALRASGIDHCSLGIQAAIQNLAETAFLECHAKVACLVRTQPIYMATFSEPVKELFKKEFEHSLLPKELRVRDDVFASTSPIAAVGNIDVDYIINNFWKHRDKSCQEYGNTPPTRIAVVSFAGLDDHDALLYPIFAHEVAHFIDFGQKDNGRHLKNLISSQLESINRQYELTSDEVRDIKARVQVFLGEMFADLMAVRLMGFPYFIALAEFLKTVDKWSDNLLVHKDGYPSMHLRLLLVLEQILNPVRGYNLRNFLEANKIKHPLEAQSLLFLLNEWENKLKALNKIDDITKPTKRSEWPKPENRMDQVMIEVFRQCLDCLFELAAELVPTPKIPILTESIFERIALIEARNPPYLEGDTPKSFHDIMFAGWAYQVVHGERRELGIELPNEKFKEYVNVCNLLIKALDLSAG